MNKLALTAIVSASLAYAYAWHQGEQKLERQRQAHTIELQTAKLKADDALFKLNAYLATIHTKHEQELQNAQKQTKEAEKRARAAIANGTLRLRDNHSSDSGRTFTNPASSFYGQGKRSGRTLSQPTAEFLVGLAARADDTNEALKTCIAQYEQVQSSLNRKAQ